MDTQDYARRLELTAKALDRQFGGRAAVRPGEALRAIGSTAIADPERAAVQRKQRHSYPFRLTPCGRRQVVLICDIALALVGPAPASGADDTPVARAAQKRGPGRPRKTRPIEDASVAGGAP